jgi:hypothetical protein
MAAAAACKRLKTGGGVRTYLHIPFKRMAGHSRGPFHPLISKLIQEATLFASRKRLVWRPAFRRNVPDLAARENGSELFNGLRGKTRGKTGQNYLMASAGKRAGKRVRTI